MIIATWADRSVIPPDMCAFAIQTGTRTADDGTDWAFFGKVAKKYGLRYRQTYYNAEALACVNSGGMVVCSMGKGRWTNGGHYILWYGVDGDMVLVNDPQSSAASRSHAPIADMYAQSKQYFCFWPPETAAPDKEEEDEMTQEQFNKMADAYQAAQAEKEPSDWSVDARAWAEEQGIITGDSKGRMQYKAPCTREQLVVFLKRLTETLDAK
ncbi:MAG: papain-like cysteine protease family protein [Clostridiaceae bacterium]|nr:papain-like cysteine protease family protein [Clostridiaceae bacterium]